MDDADAGLDKMTVFQQCVSNFNDSSVESEKCRELLTRLVRLFYVGESFTEQDATQLFFTITKLFQKENPGLRQMVYLAIKEICPLTDNAIMGMAIIMRDVQSAHSAIYRPNALRALALILDVQSIESIERLMRAAIVDSDQAVSNAALVSAYHLLNVSRDTVRRWATETQGVLMNASGIGQYHALGLLYHMRSHDKMALLKLIQQAGSGTLRSSPAAVLLIRLIGPLVDEDASLRPQLFGLLQQMLTHRSDMVQFEAARTILKLRTLQVPEESSVAVRRLQAYLGSPRAPSRFAAIRTLNRFAMVHPEAVAGCNAEFEVLIADPNRSIATYAVTALLKTGQEESVDRLIDQIGNFMGDIGDDFRVIVVDAIRSLARRFPTKHNRMLAFFGDELRQEGGLPLKLAIVEAVSDIIGSPTTSLASSRQALTYLCECMEDCEYPQVTVRVLYLLGKMGPQQEDAAQYVRYIYNRVVLENSVVRAAAVSALSKFAQGDLEKPVRMLLRQCVTDKNDEVRDRASLALNGLIIGLPKQQFALGQLEQQLQTYLATGSFDQPFDASQVQLVEAGDKKPNIEILEAQDEIVANSGTATPQQLEPSVDFEKYAEELAKIPETEGYGKLLHSSQPIPLTDEEMEYVVKAVVHIFESNVVVQYDVKNTYNCVLDLIDAIAEPDEEGLEEEWRKPIIQLKTGEQDSAYVGFGNSAGLWLGAITSRLQFMFKEEEDDEGSPEEYAMDDLEITPAIYVRPTFIGSFDHKWEELGPAQEATATRQFSQCKSIGDAVKHLESRLGAVALDGTEKPDSSATTHTLKLYGESAISREPIAAIVRLVRTNRAGVAGKVQLRSTNSEVSELLAENL